MRKILTIILLTTAIGATAQNVVVDNEKTLPKDSMQIVGEQYADSLLLDSTSLLYRHPMPALRAAEAATSLSLDPSLYDNSRGSWEINTLQGGKLFNPWRSAYVIVSGGADSMPGLLDRESGALTFQQNLGRWSFSASALADKYRFVGMSFLQTNYGVGGTVNYWVSNALTLHAFGYYYPGASMITPAVNPYLSTTNYGGFADFHINKNIGVDAGVRRYMNPMTGQWETDPIISPYFKLNGHQKIGFDLGPILKQIFFGKPDRAMLRGPVRMGPPPR